MRWVRLATLLLVACAGLARAHTGGTIGFATITADGASVRYSLALGVPSLPPELAERMRLTEAGATPDYQPLLTAVAQHVRISGDGRPCQAAPGQVTPPAGARANVLVALPFRCETPPRELSIRDDLVDVLGSDYHTLANIQWAGGSQQFVYLLAHRPNTSSGIDRTSNLPSGRFSKNVSRTAGGSEPLRT